MAELKFKHVFSANNTGKIDDFYEFKRKGQGLGEGSYGQVRVGKDKNTNVERAIKMIAKKKVKKKEQFDQENAIQQSLDHPHIVKLYEAFEDREFYYLVMEICDGGELFDRIVAATEEHEGSAFTEETAADYMMQIFGGMSYLHSNLVCHRDIKPENFLMNSKKKDAVIKIIDFGLAKKMAEKGEVMKTKAGTPYYVAPEVLKGAYGAKCDVWSCGVLLYIFICGYPPFYGDNDSEILANVKKMKFDFPEEDWSGVSKEGKDLISSMLKPESDRPEFEALLTNAWCTDHATKSGGKLTVDLAGKLKKFRRVGAFKKMAITCIATQLKDSDIEELKTAFEACDSNKDGTLTKAEILDNMQKFSLDIPEDMAATLDALDTDGSGKIDFSEFIAATLDESKFQKDELMWAAFRVFDHDNDGKISKDELKSASGKTDDDAIVAMITEADINGDGEIDFEEFKNMMQKKTA